MIETNNIIESQKDVNMIVEKLKNEDVQLCISG
jgi:hypothetical protein